jgi:AraC family transcriptional regulator
MARSPAIEWFGISTRRRAKLRPAALQWSSGGLWRGVHLEHRLDVPGEMAEGYLLRPVIALHMSSPISQELYWPGQGWKTQRVATLSFQIFPARMPYAIRWDGRSEVLLLELAPEFVAAVARRETRFERLELRPFIVTEDSFITQTMLALDSDLRGGCPYGRFYGESLGTALAAHLVRKYTDVLSEDSQTQQGSALSSTMLSRLLTYIGANLETNLSLRDLADLVQTNVYSFARSFTQSMGLPPHQYILRERIERAKLLLCDPALPLTEVALRSGFADQSHLTNAFRRMTNISPRAYRSAVASAPQFESR